MIKVQGEINIPTKTSPLCFDIEINKGDACLVIGTNGSGKTTFLDIIGGNRKLDKGRLILNSEKPIGYALQDVDNCLLPWFSVIENILLPNKLFPTDNQNDEKLKNILQQFNLLNRKDDFPYKLSGGVVHKTDGTLFAPYCHLPKSCCLMKFLRLCTVTQKKLPKIY